MVKKAKTKRITEKIMTNEKLKTQIQKKKQMFCRKLQQVVEESCNKNRNLNDSDRVLSYIRNNRRSSSKGELAFSHTNIRNEDTTRDNYICYRCKHFLEIPHNLSRPFSDRVPIFVEQCKTELSFVQAIVWLKSSIACVSQIPVKQLQQIFNRQWSGKHNHREDKHNDVEQLESSVDENLSICERTNTRDIVATSTPLREVSGVPCITPQRTICGSYTRSDDIQSKLLSSAYNSNESSFESLSLLELSSCSITATGKEKKALRSCIIPETSVESILNEDLDMFDDISEQCLEYEEGTGYSVQSTSKDDIQQINKKIIENKDFFQKSYADIPNEHKSISPAKSQSIGSMFDLERNFNGKCFTSMKRQYDLDDKMLEIDGSPKTFIITPKIVSQMSDIHEFEFPFDDNSPWQASNTAAENWNKDSAYSSISQIDTFNYDTIVRAGSITGNKRMPETQHELQPCKKKTIMYEKGKVFSFCSTNETLTPDGSPKSFIITQKDISQMSNVYNDANSEFENSSNSWRMNNNISESSKDDTAVAAESIIGNKRTLNIEHKLQPCNEKTIMYKKGKASSSYSTNRTLAFDGSPKSFIITQKDISQMSNVYNEGNSEFESPSFWRMSNNIVESLKDDAAMAAESIIGNKRTPNIEHKLHPCNEKTITSEKIMASPSILHGAIIPDINIKHRYNLRLRNKSSSCKKEASIIGEPKEHKSGRAWNLSEKRKRKKENENEDKMLSVNWLNFTLKSLCMESVIFASIKTILSTLCEKRTAEKYAICTYWKGSLEEEAVNAVLNISDIFTIENKPNICIKAIVMEIIKTLNEMTRVQFNKTYQPQISVWTYRIQIILEFCNSLPICVKITDHLITKLKSLQTVLIKNIWKKTCVMIDQLNIVFYALNITLRKYRTIISSDQRSRPAGKVIPHVADLWKIHYIDKELEHAGLDLNVTEKQWLNVLENSAIVFTENFAQFAEKSFSLVHVLIS